MAVKISIFVEDLSRNYFWDCREQEGTKSAFPLRISKYKKNEGLTILLNIYIILHYGAFYESESNLEIVFHFGSVW